ncbi:MAG: hypothetical protein JXA73_09985 [Acidobacteria bacterium]|nr:hypothetical protein [Acidobacteriota bacterium]
MKKTIQLFMIFGFLFCSSAFAQTDLNGTWQGKLAIDQNTKMTIQFIFTRRADGSYGVVLNSPDSGGIKNVAATSVKYAAGKLTVEVANLSGTYVGTVAKGTMTGEWRQQGSTLPLVLTPYKKPEAAALKPLLGRWEGKFAPPGSGELTIVFRFETAKDGNIAGFLDVPEQGAKGIPIGDVVLEGSRISLKIPSLGFDYTGKLIRDGMDGSFKQSGAEFELDLSKGKYQPPPLNVPVETMNTLLGKWAGKLDIPGDVLHNIILRFEKTKDGRLFAYWDCPERGSVGGRVADVVLKLDQFSCRIPATGGKFAGKLVKDTISGTYETAGKQYQLNLVKGAKYEPQVAQLDIPAEVMNQLLGRWTCKLGGLSIIFRFEQNPDGKNAIFIDIPEQNVKGLRILKASMKDGNLWMKMSGSEYTGKISGDKIDGSLKLLEQGGNSIPLPLTKG